MYHLIGLQHHRPCVPSHCIYIAIPCASTTVLRNLCCAIVCTWSSSCSSLLRRHRPAAPLPYVAFGLLTFRLVVSTPTLLHPTKPLRIGAPLPCTSNIGNTGACFCPRHIAGSSKPSPCLGLGSLTATTLPSPSTSTASLPFFYIHKGPDCVDLGIPLPQRPPRCVVRTNLVI